MSFSMFDYLPLPFTARFSRFPKRLYDMNTYPHETRLPPLILPPVHPALSLGADPRMTPSTWEMPSTVLSETQAGPRTATESQDGCSTAESFESAEPLSGTDEEDMRSASPEGGDEDWHVVSETAGPDPDRTVATLLNMLGALERQARELEARRVRLLARRGEVERELLRTKPWVLAREVTGEEAFWWERRVGKGDVGARELREIEKGLEVVEVGLKGLEKRRERVVRLLVGVWGVGV